MEKNPKKASKVWIGLPSKIQEFKSLLGFASSLVFIACNHLVLHATGKAKSQSMVSIKAEKIERAKTYTPSVPNYLSVSKKRQCLKLGDWFSY
jgi:hypothetical protein